MPPRQTPWNATLRERLDALSMPEPNSGCRLWLGCLVDGRYGKVSWEGKQIGAHRAAWSEKNGPIPPGKKVLHKCDVSICIEETHLFIGDDAANAMDKARKMRTTTALSRDAVLAIHQDTRPQTVVATQYGISRQSVGNIQNGRRFAWLTTSEA